MDSRLLTIIVALALSTAALAQSSGAGATNPASAPSAQTSQAHKEANAASATKDTTAISGDQVTKPAGAKSATLIGCLSGRDAQGNYVLSSMQYRHGVEVLGPSDLDNAAGQKVKLTGQWVPAPASSEQPNETKARRFQVTSFDLMADKCPPPAEATPISKKKQQQQKAAASEKPGNNPH